MEMASGKPPFYDLPPLTALFKLGSTEVVPDVPAELSDVAKDFLGRCFQRYGRLSSLVLPLVTWLTGCRDPELRATAEELLEHPFLAGVGEEQSHLEQQQQLQQQQEAKENMYSSDLGSMISFLQEHSIVSLQR